MWPRVTSFLGYAKEYLKGMSSAEEERPLLVPSKFVRDSAWYDFAGLYRLESRAPALSSDERRIY
jgi:hypothetical protein